MKAIILTLGLLASSEAWAHDAKLLDILGHIDVIPTRQQLVEASATTNALSSIARDTKLDRYRRARAASMLAHFPGEPTQKVLEELALDEATDREVRIQAMFSLAILGALRVPTQLSTTARDEVVRAMAGRARNVAIPTASSPAPSSGRR